MWGRGGVPDALRVDQVVTQGKTKKNDDHETSMYFPVVVSHMSQFQEEGRLRIFFFFFFFQKKVTSCTCDM